MKIKLTRRNIDSKKKNLTERKVPDTRKLGTQRLIGVRGWLLVFVVLVLGNSLISIAIGLAGLKEKPALILMLAIGVYGCYVFGLLVSKKGSAPKHAAGWLIAELVLTILYAVLLYLETRETTPVPAYAIGILVWLLYLKRSKRVKITYGRFH